VRRPNTEAVILVVILVLAILALVGFAR